MVMVCWEQRGPWKQPQTQEEQWWDLNLVMVLS